MPIRFMVFEPNVEISHEVKREARNEVGSIDLCVPSMGTL